MGVDLERLKASHPSSAFALAACTAEAAAALDVELDKLTREGLDA